MKKGEHSAIRYGTCKYLSLATLLVLFSPALKATRAHNSTYLMEGFTVRKRFKFTKLEMRQHGDKERAETAQVFWSQESSDSTFLCATTAEAVQSMGYAQKLQN